jgi:predicted Holliday junction resolvase-like endonuclease
LCAITRAGGRRKGEKEGNVAKKSKVRDLVDEIEEVKKKMEIDLRRAKRRQIIENTAENEEEWDALENDEEDSDNFIE